MNFESKIEILKIKILILILRSSKTVFERIILLDLHIGRLFYIHISTRSKIKSERDGDCVICMCMDVEWHKYKFKSTLENYNADDIFLSSRTYGVWYVMC